MNKLKLLLASLVALFIPMWGISQQPAQTKLTEINIHNVETIEERVFLVHSIQNSEFFSYRLSNEEGKIDIFVSEDYTCQETNANADFDAFLEQLEEEWMAYTNLDKTERGQLFVDWRYQLDDPVFLMLNEDFHRQLRDNNTCDGAEPFCTDNGLYQFPASTNAGNLGSSTQPYYCSGFVRPNGSSSSCLSTTPNPAFYYMQIEQPGNLNIYMYSTPSVDIDFDCWGPFTDINTACSQLSCSNMVDCSYSASATENCYINNAQTGQYYILLITNYSNQTCNISFSNIGTGTTNCGILPPLVSGGGPYCVGETIHLTAQGQAGATYHWTGPGGFNSNLQNPTRPNCTLNMAGVYTCTITVGSQTNSATTEAVVIYPQPTANFNFTTVCVGNPTQFTSTSTTNPSGQTIQSYQWNFGDGQTGTGANPTHTYTNPGTYQVTLNVGCGGHCTSQITKSVQVFGQPTSNFTYNTVCKGTPTQFTSTATAPAGQTISSYQWDFGDGQTGSGQTVSHTYAQAGNFQVTHTVGVGSGNCTGSRTQTVPVYATPNPTATAQPSIVIYGGTATLTANAGTTGSFNFHWEPADKVVSPNSQTTQTISLQQTTTFTCTVTNPQGNCTGSTQVTVSIEGSNMTANATADQTELCEGESTTLHALPAGGTGTYTYSWTPANTLNNASIQNPVATPPLGLTTYTCHISDGMSAQDVSIAIRVYPNTESHPVVSICPDDTYDFFGEQLSVPGPYEHTIANSHGCDSTIYLTLNNYETYETPITRYICQQEYYDFFGTQVSEPDTYFHTLETVNGCDSVIILTLLNYDRYEYTISDDFCEGSAYFFNGQHITEPGQYVYNGQTVNGCDSIVHLNLGLSDYNTKTYNVETCGQDYTWPSNGFYYWAVGDYHVVDTVPGPYCDSIVTLNLSINAVYPDILWETTSCDTYTWPNVGGLFYTENGQQSNQGKTYTESGYYTRYYQTARGCDSIVTLNLNINNFQTSEFTVADDESCNEYYWDPQGHIVLDYWGHEDPVYNQSGIYKRTYQDVLGCDSIAIMNVNFEYTPNPTDIYPMDATDTVPHWVVTATEFQINAYDFNLWDSNPNCHWDTVTWTCDEAPDWVLEPFGNHGQCCKVYVLNRVDDTIWLKAHAFNRCTPPEGIEQKYWLICSFYGIEEFGSTLSNFDVIPNPNNGQMQLKFEYLTGKVNIKVYDMKGTLIDSFDTYNNNGPSSFLYNMKNKSEGIYFFVATSKEGTMAKKVVIHK